MKQRSLKTKLLLLTLGLFLASGVAMTWIQSSSLNGLRDDIMAQTRGALEQEVSRSLQFQAERYAVQIEDQLQQAYQIPLGMAAQLEGSMAQPDQRLSRPQVELLLGSRLHQANGISSIYAQFEPNGYDEQDADWQTGASHSVAGKGSLEVYFMRIPVNLNSDSGICEHHFRKVCGQGFCEQKLSFEGRHLFDSPNKPAAKRSAAVVDPGHWSMTVHLTSEFVL
ncbi:hypothetical protein [Aeromonas caviae]|uniref:hypothetical protein n=2 Tax=Pseudomonadota TaxID=1224 RepID=UPI00085289E8|nr:hypothetical protein [Aeromonas caviae]OEG05963.1 hypothetical protein BFG06_03630 [Aeromonas caviae]